MNDTNMKTAITIAIEWVEEELVLQGYEHEEIIAHLKILHEIEKRQIEDAYNAGFAACKSYSH